MVFIYLYLLSHCCGLRPTKCYIRSAPLAAKKVRIKWREDKRTKRTEKAYYYVCGDGEVRIPQFGRQRAFICNILKAATAKVNYTDPSQILQQLKNIGASQDFETVRSLFLDLYRWFAFKKNEFIKHGAFHDIRTAFKSKHVFFGRVYSRILKRCFKFSKCYDNHKQLSLANYYVKWINGNIPSYEKCMKDIINQNPLDKPERLMNRVLSLVDMRDLVEVLNALFKDVRSGDYNFYTDSRLSKPKLLNSVAALWLYRLVTSTENTRMVILAHQITQVKTHRSALLGLLGAYKGECPYDYGWRMVTSVVRAFEQIYKLLRRLTSLEGKRLMEHCSVGCEIPSVTREEMFSINLLAKIELFERRRDPELLLSGLFDIVTYLTQRFHGRSIHDDGARFFQSFKQLVCIPYLVSVMKAMAYERTSLLRMKGVVGALKATSQPTNYKLYMPRAALMNFMSYGMNMFCSILDYHKSPPTNLSDVFAILTKGGDTCIYRSSDKQIVASTDCLTMDLWNIGDRSILTGPIKCQLVIRSHVTDIGDNIVHMVNEAKKRITQDIGAPLEFDSLVNLHFPNHAEFLPMTKFHPNVLKKSEKGHLFEHPIHKFMTIFVDV